MDHWLDAVEQLALLADEAGLSLIHLALEFVLDRIDEIVPPGTTLSRRDAGYVPPALADPRLRRRR